ncbi:hypothetical protein K7X08_033858 [Anisodus acutangulus]|uniref:C2H2-type domain-containing protein n=1 Tax=Anisodus acutangulus TaxID=402998 RepID=A0A9Q1M6E0_9SOLA|nr:hypothetical protein K7X08_033858 [Anisodus acutangulus]
MTNTSGSRDQGASENPQSSTPVSFPSPSPPPPATPVSEAPANRTTTASTEISTNSIAGGSSTSSTGIAINPIASIGIGSSRSDVPPKKRGSMLAAGEGSSGGGAGEGDQPRNVRPNAPPADSIPVEKRRCLVCQRVFDSVKALFGHMNCHSDRRWKGVYPPPTFNREEEFADLLVKMEPTTEVGDDAPVLPHLNVSERAAEERRYQLPDLNLPPPEEEQ